MVDVRKVLQRGAEGDWSNQTIRDFRCDSGQSGSGF